MTAPSPKLRFNISFGENVLDLAEVPPTEKSGEQND
jgi:hypothetical protein